MFDIIDKPEHYNRAQARCRDCGRQIECIDIVESLPYCIGNAIKYLWRCEYKGKPVEDLEKAIAYIKFEIERRKRN